MSLINKMLQDLEARHSVTAGSTAAVYQDLRPVSARSRNRVSRRRLAVLLGVLAVGVAAYVAVGRPGLVQMPAAAKPLPASGVNAARARSTAIAVAPPPAAVSAPVPAVARASAVGANGSDNAPATAAPSHAVSDAKPAISKPITAKPITAKPITAKPITAKPITAKPVAKAASHSTHSHESANVRIVKQLKSPPVSMRKSGRAARTSSKKLPAAASGQTVLVDKKVHPLTPGERAESSYRQAVHLLDQGRAADAEALLREALRAQPTHVKARELAAGLALQSGHWRSAQSLLEEGLRQVPSHYLFARLLARVYLDHGAEDKALTVMENAAVQGSDDPDFNSLLGLLYQRAGRHADAVKEYERSLALRPGDARTWLGFAISLESVKQWSAAKNAYRRATENGGLTPALTQYARQRLAALKNQ